MFREIWRKFDGTLVFNILCIILHAVLDSYKVDRRIVKMSHSLTFFKIILNVLKISLCILNNNIHRHEKW